MERTTEKLKKDLQDAVAGLRRMRDEMRVDLHLAGMDARDEWKKLEERFTHVEQAANAAAGDVTERTKQTVDDLSKAFGKFRESVKAAIRPNSPK
jgi:hypothetical protein